ncbi:MAG: hypothetical protein I3273_03505 [Candidatus Moeniiplasma glomeromycotorum]|nr:hypothetical protein [Candidatus Moeniiplasma glomeromycotorum]MCE8167769.1 hypothetical protein [Candidatus Moeniiplasma glomeromycotorum]MCE8169168.1 hypothetical protein [Candidatus Moeniiplasma glomeromycotorum]
MTNNQKKKKTEWSEAESASQQLLEAWNSLKKKIIASLINLDSFKSNQELVNERYEKRLRKKKREIRVLEEEFEFLDKILLELNEKVSNIKSTVVSKELVLSILDKRYGRFIKDRE